MARKLKISACTYPYQHIKDFLPIHVTVGVEDFKETVKSVLKKLDHLLSTDVTEISQHYSKVLSLLTPLQQHEDLNCGGGGEGERM